MIEKIDKNTALLLIDVQKGLSDPVYGERNNPQAESNIGRLLTAWRETNRPVVHVKHCSIEPNSPLQPGLPGNEFKPEALPNDDEILFSKTVNSAFIGTGLEQYLKQNNIGKLVVAGLTTDHCVSTSVRMASNLGFEVTLVADATATHERTGSDGVVYDAEQMHQINLVSLNNEFCTLLDCEQVLDRI